MSYYRIKIKNVDNIQVVQADFALKALELLGVNQEDVISIEECDKNGKILISDKERSITMGKWEGEINMLWKNFCPEEIRHSFSGEQLNWIKSFASYYKNK